MPDELVKIRERLSNEYGDCMIKETRVKRVAGFRAGFNACFEIMQEREVKLMEALTKISNEQFLDEDELEAWFIAREALKELDAENVK